MKQNIHPTFYPEAQVICACGNTWTTGSTIPIIHTDVCSNCHPFYTGEQRIVDTEGQVDRFFKKLQARQQFIEEAEAREAARTSPARPVSELDLGNRATEALTRAGLSTVGQVLDRLALGEQALLSVEGFGRKSLADLKKRLRQFGYQLPEAAEEIKV
jgi:large subunit ribosomal protein L31